MRRAKKDVMRTGRSKKYEKAYTNGRKSLKVPFKLLINAFSILRRAFKIEKGGV